MEPVERDNAMHTVRLAMVEVLLDREHHESELALKTRRLELRRAYPGDVSLNRLYAPFKRKGLDRELRERTESYGAAYDPSTGRSPFLPHRQFILDRLEAGEEVGSCDRPRIGPDRLT